MSNAIIPRTGRVLSLLAAVAALCTVASPAWAGTPINQRAAADPGGAVEISNVAGTVRVTGWDRNEVEVTGELGEGTERLDFAVVDKVTRVKVILPNRSNNVEDTDLVVRIPTASRLAVTTVSADIEVQDVTGAQRLQTVSARHPHRGGCRGRRVQERQRRRRGERVGQEGAGHDHHGERRRDGAEGRRRGERQHGERQPDARASARPPVRACARPAAT